MKPMKLINTNTNRRSTLVEHGGFFWHRRTAGVTPQGLIKHTEKRVGKTDRNIKRFLLRRGLTFLPDGKDMMDIAPREVN